MQKRTAYSSLFLASVAILAVGLVAFFALGQTVKWVGRTDVEVRFVVTDAQTGQPIPNAVIYIRAEPGGFCDDPPVPKFAITTDRNGHATQVATHCMCFGSKGAFEDTFASHLPPWWFHVTSTGYSATEPTYLDAADDARQVQRGEPFATITVPIRLRKDAAKLKDGREPE